MRKDKPVYYYEIFFKTVKHFFGKLLLNWIKNLEDFRIKLKCKYPVEYMIWIGLLLFILKMEARRQLKCKFNVGKFIENMNQFLNLELESRAHSDTLEYFCEGFALENLELLRLKMIQRLLRMKALSKFRLLDKYYLIVIDGTGNLTFKKPHCEKCLKKELSNGKIIYYHPVLEAKLICKNGLALSIGTEFIENEEGKKETDPQDCELKASYRLIERIKKDYPQLSICLLADSLYANQNVFQYCKDYVWKCIITFKEGSIPFVQEEFEALKKFQSSNVLQRKNQKFCWINNINYEGHLLNVLECKEIKKGEEKTFCWATNFSVDKENVVTLANDGGRLRWKIENEGFNMQKNGGYNLEHQFSSDDTAMKNYYILMQIAHIINQLVEKGSLLMASKKTYDCIKNLAEDLISSLKFMNIDFDAVFFRANIYISFDTS